jgi:hypothetical protein
MTVWMRIDLRIEPGRSGKGLVPPADAGLQHRRGFTDPPGWHDGVPRCRRSVECVAGKERTMKKRFAEAALFDVQASGLGDAGMTWLSCLNCEGELDLVQPDPQRSAWLLGVCPECHTWVLIDDETKGFQEIALPWTDC